MKKKILLTITIAIAIMFLLTAYAFADSVHEGRVDLDATVTLDNGKTINLFDDDGNALIWYLYGGELKSIRADDERVRYKATYYFTVDGVPLYEVSDMWIALENENVSKGNIVVLNLMDDDVLITEPLHNGKPVNCLKGIMWANKVLEYAYLRLDTAAIQMNAFCGCDNLKYVNLEDLTELRQIGGGAAFSTSPRLFAGETLDLRGTKLKILGGTAAFNNGNMTAILLPNTVYDLGLYNIQGTKITSFAIPTSTTFIDAHQFNDCTELKYIYINNTTTKIANRVFNNTALEKVFYIGTLEELNALLDNTSTENNAPFWAVVGENRSNLISYTDYKALEDKSGNYVVYDFSYCEAYLEGAHIVDTARSNACVTVCSTCGDVEISHKNENISVEYVYESYLENGNKITVCLNDGCGYEGSETLPSLFTSRGYSYEEGERGGIVVDFGVNYIAIDEYEKATGKTLTYGMFAANKNKLGTNDIFDENGNTNEGAMIVEVGNDSFISLKLRIIGLVGEQKNVDLALGVYVKTLDSEGESVSFLQNGEKIDGDKYAFVSYNGLCKEDEE